MQPESLNTIREKFLAFFEEKGHLRLPSFSLVPANDPSVLLVNAGMTPLKPYFTGKETPPALRVTTCQKCIRTPDIERVGQTSRHGTYFEMLGNFSFGDYFKKEIIPWAWEFCTQTLQMPADQLFVSVYEEDDEAFAIWQEDVGLAEERIYRMGKEDNFWEHGTGPCGPSSEIYFDRGLAHGCGQPDCQVGCECDRFVEIWNLVFTQFNREEDGSYTPLAKKNIDTGAGLERLACVMQDVDNLFEVDTIRAILDHACQLVQVEYGKDDKKDIAIRVITDHIRSTTMMISDGIIPANEGRGYVLRRLLRRAARYGRLLGQAEPFLYKLVATVVRESVAAYPDLKDNTSRIEQIIRYEEERFATTIQQGSQILADLISQARAAGQDRLDGRAVFRLHDTYGFPFDLTREIAQEAGLELDESGFLAEMEKQKETARQALQAKAGSAWSKTTLPDLVRQEQATVFTGYDSLIEQGQILHILLTDENGQPELVSTAQAGQLVTVITDRTPFYAQAGGQVGDTGQIETPAARLIVQDTTKSAENIYFHQTLVEQGVLEAGQTAWLRVDAAARLATARNHTTTHLLHKALSLVVGDHVRQAGSAVSPQRLRFDFAHFQPLSQDQLDQVEDLVNQEILLGSKVTTEIKTIEEARRDGAVALFDEKYSDLVRVVSVGGFSKELCGGTHLANTSEAGQFRILSENGIAAGVRRIEAVTGSAAWQLTRQQEDILRNGARLLNTPVNELTSKLEQVLERIKLLEKDLALKRQEKLKEAAASLTDQLVEMAGIKTLVTTIEAADPAGLRDAADQLRDKLTDYLIVLAADIDGKAAWVAMLSPQAIKAGLSAGQLVKAAAQLTGGGGGGRPDMAQAGGKNPAGIPAAIKAVQDILQEKLK